MKDLLIDWLITMTLVSVTWVGGLNMYRRTVKL